MAPTFSFSEEETIAAYLNRRCWHFACWALPLLAMDLWRLLLSLALTLAAGLHSVSWVAVVGIEALLEECAETKGLVRRKISGAGWEWEWEWVERERERAERVKDMVERVKEMEREIRERAQRERMQREKEEREREEREREERERKEREDRERADREREERERNLRERADREREERERNLREQLERERNCIEDNPHEHSDLDSDSDLESDTPSDTDFDTSDPDSDTPSSSSSSPKAEPTKDTPSANSPPQQTQVSITASGNTPFNFTFKSEEKSAEPVIRTGGSRWLSSEEEYLLLLCKESRNWAQISQMVNARFARCRTQGACSSKYYKLRNGASTS